MSSTEIQSTPEVPAQEPLLTPPTETVVVDARPETLAAELRNACALAGAQAAELREASGYAEAAAGALAEVAHRAQQEQSLLKSFARGAAWAFGCTLAAWGLGKLLERAGGPRPAHSSCGPAARAQEEEDAQVEPTQPTAAEGTP